MDGGFRCEIRSVWGFKAQYQNERGSHQPVRSLETFTLLSTDIFCVSSYHYYARLVIASFGLHCASDFNLIDMPAALARSQSTATHLIECFESDFDGTGFTRGDGCPCYCAGDKLAANT